MARGRESKYIKHITHRDIELFKQLARTGVTDRSQSEIFAKVNGDRLKKLENSGYIKRDTYCVSGKSTEIIRLNSKGKTYCSKELNIKSFAAAQSNHLEHDLKLSLAYYSLSGETRETWMHERDIIKEIYVNYPEVKGNLKTCIDARIEVNGIKVAIEIVGSSYSQKDIADKETIAMNLAACSTIEFLR